MGDIQLLASRRPAYRLCLPILIRTLWICTVSCDRQGFFDAQEARLTDEAITSKPMTPLPDPGHTCSAYWLCLYSQKMTVSLHLTVIGGLWHICLQKGLQSICCYEKNKNTKLHHKMWHDSCWGLISILYPMGLNTVNQRKCCAWFWSMRHPSSHSLREQYWLYCKYSSLSLIYHWLEMEL